MVKSMVQLNATGYVSNYNWEKRIFDAVCYTSNEVQIGQITPPPKGWLIVDSAICQSPDSGPLRYYSEVPVTSTYILEDYRGNRSIAAIIRGDINAPDKKEYITVRTVGFDISAQFNIVETVKSSGVLRVELPPVHITDEIEIVYHFHTESFEINIHRDNSNKNCWIEFLDYFNPDNYKSSFITNLPKKPDDEDMAVLIDGVTLSGEVIFEVTAGNEKRYVRVHFDDFELEIDPIYIAEVYTISNYGLLVDIFGIVYYVGGLTSFILPLVPHFYIRVDDVAIPIEIEYQANFKCNGGSKQYSKRQIITDGGLFVPILPASEGITDTTVNAWGRWVLNWTKNGDTFTFTFKNFTYSVYDYDWLQCDDVKAEIEHKIVLHYVDGSTKEFDLEPVVATSDVCSQLPKKDVFAESFDSITPACVCYRNSEASKTVTYTISYFTRDYNPKLYNIKYSLLRVYYDDVILYDGVAKEEITITFNLPENTVKHVVFELYGDGYVADRKTVIVERRQYCHAININAKTYDLEGNETNKFPHPTSADYDENKHSEIIVKIKIKDEQGNYIDVPVDKIKTNWQYNVEKVDTGVYQMKILNTADNALNIQDYGISVYIDKQWCNENGYYNKYNIEAENIIINSDKIEKIGLWNFNGIDHYENGVTYLKQKYEKVSGIFVNPIVEFSIVEQLNKERDRWQYSYCYRIYDSPMELNLPTYTDEEKKELAKAIVREMGKPRKIETFTILSKEIPKINSSITVNYNGQLISMPVYSVRFSLENSNIQIQIRNDQLKLLKDYLSLIK